MGVPLYFKSLLQEYDNILLSQNNNIKRVIYFLI